MDNVCFLSRGDECYSHDEWNPAIIFAKGVISDIVSLVSFLLWEQEYEEEVFLNTLCPHNK